MIDFNYTLITRYGEIIKYRIVGGDSASNDPEYMRGIYCISDSEYMKRIHCLSGPAVQWKNEGENKVHEEWYINGRRIYVNSQKEFELYLRNKDFFNFLKE